MSLDTTPKTWTPAPLLAAELNTEVRDALIGIQAAWDTWVPTFSGLAIGNGTYTARYSRVGKTVRYRLVFTAGTTTTFSGSFTFSLPVTVRGDYLAGAEPIGSVILNDDSAGAAARAGGSVFIASAGSSLAGMVADNFSPGNVNSTVPWTWATSDRFAASGEYEAA